MERTGQRNEWAVEIPGGEVTLPGILGMPEEASGIVLFAHGSGSGRFSPRNNAVARELQDAGLATVLVDLLAEMETYDRRLVFDIELLAARLLQCTEWLHANEGTRTLPIGYFGASTGAAAALIAAAHLGSEVRAVVSRGGRPDLAGEHLSRVQSPTLLIVGGLDGPVITLNEQALTQLHCEKDVVIVPGATHLFEEPGTLEEVSHLARDWFLRYLRLDGFVVRPPEPGELDWVVHRHGALYMEEYGWDETFEALVARIVADYTDRRDLHGERAWIAEVDGAPAGCVFCMRRDETTAQLRLLLVEPRARGMGIGKRLVEECLRFARSAGYTRIMLWTNDVLVDARRIYEQAGFELLDEEPHHSFGHDLVGQNWGRTL